MPALVEGRATKAIDFNQTVGYNIYLVRIKKKVSARELAAIADISPSQMSRVERGDRGLTFAQGLAIAKRLKVNPRHLADPDTFE